MNNFRFKKSVLSLITAGCLISTTVFAAFPDVTSQYSWAADAINSMADSGIIKGYEDGSFQPAKSISKLEGLVLISRILGFSDSENSAFVDEAAELYSDTFGKYPINFGQREVSYLLLKGVLTADELDDYIGDDNYSVGLKRYEVATLLTKALDAGDSLASAANLEYKDADSIPASAKKYVKYVTDQGLMNGMDDNTFSPNTDVTRAQAAVVLKKLQNKTGYTFKSGTVAEMDTVTGIIKLKDADGATFSHSLLPTVILRYDGERIAAGQIESGYYASVTYKNNEVYAIDFAPSNADELVCGALTSVNKSSTNPTIGVALLADDAIEPSSEKTTFKLASDVVISYKGESTGIGSLKTNSFVKLYIKSGKVKSIEAEDRVTNASGTIESVSFSPKFSITVTNKSGDSADYLFKNDASITRNGKSSDASQLAEGDVVSLTLDYGRISKMSATSKNTSKSGVITGILISSNPKLTLTVDGEDVTYPISTSAVYSITGSATNSIYDLRTNTVATVDIESNTITKITTTAATETLTVTGSVVSVTPAANVFQVSHTDVSTGVVQTDTVIVNSKTTIMDTNGKSRRISELKNGNNVTVYGTIGSGVLAAATVMIIN